MLIVRPITWTTICPWIKIDDLDVEISSEYEMQALNVQRNGLTAIPEPPISLLFWLIRGISWLSVITVLSVEWKKLLQTSLADYIYTTNDWLHVIINPSPLDVRDLSGYLIITARVDQEDSPLLKEALYTGRVSMKPLNRPIAENSEVHQLTSAQCSPCGYIFYSSPTPESSLHIRIDCTHPNLELTYWRIT